MLKPKVDIPITLVHARKHVMSKRLEGTRCPCCDQFAKIYRRRLDVSMVIALLDFYRLGGITDFVHGPSITGSNRGGEARLQYWGLIESQISTDPDKGRRGYWRVTRRGQLFLQNKITVPEFAMVYNAQCLGLRGEPIRVTTALGTKFSLKKLMQE